MAYPKRGTVAGMNQKAGLDVKNPGVKTAHIPHRNGDKSKRTRFDRVFRLFQASKTSLLVHHEISRVGNPDALLFVFVALGSIFAGPHY
jgi:hypothetical protein